MRSWACLGAYRSYYFRQVALRKRPAPSCSSLATEGALPGDRCAVVQSKRDRLHPPEGIATMTDSDVRSQRNRRKDSDVRSQLNRQKDAQAHAAPRARCHPAVVQLPVTMGPRLKAPQDRSCPGTGSGLSITVKREEADQGTLALPSSRGSTSTCVSSGLPSSLPVGSGPSSESLFNSNVGSRSTGAASSCRGTNPPPDQHGGPGPVRKQAEKV